MWKQLTLSENGGEEEKTQRRSTMPKFVLRISNADFISIQIYCKGSFLMNDENIEIDRHTEHNKHIEHSAFFSSLLSLDRSITDKPPRSSLSLFSFTLYNKKCSSTVRWISSPAHCSSMWLWRCCCCCSDSNPFRLVSFDYKNPVLISNDWEFDRWSLVITIRWRTRANSRGHRRATDEDRTHQPCHELVQDWKANRENDDRFCHEGQRTNHFET